MVEKKVVALGSLDKLGTSLFLSTFPTGLCHRSFVKSNFANSSNYSLDLRHFLHCLVENSLSKAILV